MSTTKVTDSVRDTTAVDAAKITTGTIPEARITTLDATKLTGNIADARIPASAVTQHVTATDLTPIRQDLAMLALYNAVSDNRAAYNLPSSFIDQFEDDTGLTTQTDVDRNDRYEFVASMSSGAPYISPTNPSANTIVSTSSPNLQQHAQTPGHIGSSVHDGNWGSYFDTQDGQNWQNGWLYEDYGSGNEKKFAQSALQLYGASCTGSYNVHASNDASTWTLIHTGAVGEFTTAASGSGTQTIGGLVYQFTAPATAYRYWKMTFSSATSGNTSSNDWSEIKFYEETIIANATGTLISDTQTASSATTKMSGVILYKDNAGTATLGTDLKIYLSANNGGAWTEAASYGAVTPLFSTGVKMVRLGETTVTSGTAPVIKAVWANQVASSSAAYVTGDRSSTITVTTNMTLGAGTVPTLVDGTFATLAADAFYWNNHTPSAGAYIQFAFSTATVCSEAKWYQDVVATTHGTWQWQGSNTAGGASGYSNIGSTFTLGGGGTAPWPFTTLTQLNSNTTAYLYYRLAWQSGAVSIGSWNGEVEFKQGVDVTGKETQLHGWAMNY